ncbi:DUF2268 domain-containing putative Zn-dependent protease [Clostridium saccharoperbutylacetonicum]
MENNVVNLAIKQMKCGSMNELIVKEAFFEEYFNVFCNNTHFDKDAINKFVNDIRLKDAISFSDRVVEIFNTKINILQRLGIENKIGLIIFIGDGNIDGHSIILNDNSYVFVDLKAIILRSNKNFDLDTFISHEIIHAIHYNLNVEFYPKNYKSIEDMYLKVLIEEGMATYLSINLFEISKEIGYWLGFLENNEVNEWIFNCEKMRFDIGINLKELIANSNFDKDMYNRLFCIKSEKFTFYRLGYYYGYEIIKNICNKHSFKDLLCLNFIDIKKEINDYFKTDLCK